MIYLYAITEAGVEPPDQPGLDEQPLCLIEAGSIAGLCSCHERSSFDPEPAALWRHDSVVEAAMSRGAVLPARFGTTFAETGGLVAALENDADRFCPALEEVRGCVELAVRVSLPDSAGAPPRSGREYVDGELTRRRERRAVADRTLLPLEAHAVRARTGDPQRGDLTASYLVRADAVDTFAARVRDLARSHTELAVSCTGPWPPYSFVGQEDA